MPKGLAVLAVSGVLGGMGALFDGQSTPDGQGTPLDFYHVEVGVAFSEAAVRAPLPRGLEPASGFTGGIAIHQDRSGSQQTPASSAHVWIDIEIAGSPARYVLSEPLTMAVRDARFGDLGTAAVSEVREWVGGVHQIMARPDEVSRLEVVVKPSSEPCTRAFRQAGASWESDGDESLRVSGSRRRPTGARSTQRRAGPNERTAGPRIANLHAPACPLGRVRDTTSGGHA